jgi:hypothetical protein
MFLLEREVRIDCVNGWLYIAQCTVPISRQIAPPVMDEPL